MTATVTVTNLGGDFSTKKISWVGMGDAETGVVVRFPEYADRSIHVTGTFGGGAVALHGSNDGVNYAPLNDPTGAAISLAITGIVAVQEVTNYVRPVTSGGTGSNLNVYLIMRRPVQLRT